VRRLRRSFLVTICGFLSAGAIAFGLECWTAIHTRYELDYGEGPVLWQAQRVTHLSEAFHRIDNYPHMPFNYMPLYHLTSRGLAWFTDDLLSAGRWVSFLSALLTGVAIGLLARLAIPAVFSVFERTAAAVMCGLLCFNLNTISWAQFMRVDMLAIFLTFAGLLVFALAPHRRGLDYFAFLLFVLAWFTKQTYVAAPVACLTIAFIADRRRAIRLSIFSALLAVSGLAALAVPTHGIALLNLFTYNKNPFSVLNMLGIVQLNLATMVPLAAIVFAVPLAMSRRVAWLPRARRWMVVRHWVEGSQARRTVAISSLHMLLALAVSFTCGKKGSNYNYFLEWNLACCVPAGFMAAFALRRIGAKAISASPAVVLMLLLLFSTNGPATLAERLRPRSPSALAKDNEQVMAFLRATPGPVYSENMTLVLESGKDSPAEPDLITNLTREGAWDEQPFVDQLAAGYYSAVIVTTSLDNRNRYTRAVQAAIEKGYALDRRYGEFRIFLPKPH
jgi:hypothetical protein